MTKTFIGMLPDFEDSEQIIISKWKTMEEAIEFAKKMFWFNWTHLEKAKWDNDCWIGTMKRSEYKVNTPKEI